MPTPQRNDVWLVDLGLAAKVRPALVVSIPSEDRDRALVTIVPHTTAVRGTRFETAIATPFLKPGAFDVQQLLTIPEAKLIRRLGGLTLPQMELVETALRSWLALGEI
jgi:mRNA interferase MazF